MNNRFLKFLVFVKTQNINLIQIQINIRFYLQVKMQKRKLGPYLTLKEKKVHRKGTSQGKKGVYAYSMKNSRS